jgi:hypothetical protein
VISKYGIKTTRKRLAYFPRQANVYRLRKQLSNGELYTILTNKAAKGKKGTIVADRWH